MSIQYRPVYANQNRLLRTVNDRPYRICRNCAYSPVGATIGRTFYVVLDSRTRTNAVRPYGS